MKRVLIAMLALISFSALQAQEKPIVTVEGDLNKDGVTDKVVYNPSLHVDENFTIYFGDANGGYNLFRSYDVGLYNNPQISITDKGVIRIQEGVAGNCDVFLFRYENGDIRCTGGKKDRHNDDHFDVSYNFLTGKMIRTDGEGKGKKSVTSDMPAIPVLRLGWFPLDFDELGYLFEDGEWDDAEDMLEYKTVTGIYRLLQEKGLVSASFLEFHDLIGSAESVWSTYNEIMKYACYNYSSSLFIDKQNDGSYWIHFMDEYEDRTYEQYIDEFDGDIDKAFEKAEQENGGEPSYKKFDEEWVFKDGRFTKVNDELMHTLLKDYEPFLSSYPHLQISVSDDGLVKINTGTDTFQFRDKDGDYVCVNKYFPPLRLGWFPLDYSQLGFLFEENDFEEQLEYKTVRGLFQLLPDNDILDVEESNPYNAYREDFPWRYDADEGWSTGYEVMRQGDFFILSTVKIKKQADESYRFLSEYSLEDKYYERFLDDNMENWEEAKKKALKERGRDMSFYSETEWLFKDGKFTLIRKETKK